MGYFLLVLFLVTAITAGLGLYAAVGIGHNKPKADYPLDSYDFPWHEAGYDEEIKNWVKKIKRDYHYVVSPYFYDINTLEIKNNDREKWIILLHGVTMNHKGMLDYAYMFSRMGYNIMLWDSRFHGESGGKSISYGYYEKYDLKAVIDNLRDKYGDHIKTGLLGVSMGASIVLSYASGIRDDCDFYIADCPYSDFRRQASDVVQRMLRTPRFYINAVMAFAAIFVRLFYKFDIGKIRIIDKVQRIENPVLFMNCLDDAYIDPAMSRELFEKCNAAKKDKCWFETGGHGGAFGANRTEYIAKIEEFLKNIGF